MTARKPLRLWPGVVAAAILLVARLILPIVMPDAGLYGAIVGLACSLAIVIWWLFFSRAAWIERIGALVMMVAAVLAMAPLVHISISNAMMGMMLPVYSAFILPPALVAWAVITRRLSNGVRRVLLVVTMLLASGAFTLLRTEGISSAGSQLAWRWTKTPEEKLLAQAPEPSLDGAREAPKTAPAAVPKAPKDPIAPGATEKPRDAAPKDKIPVPKRDPEWPGFRGRGRDGAVRGVRINTDWRASPPQQLWRRAIGPGWSSFAVDGDLIYTQEQRGEYELVVCYRLSTGEPVWRHRDNVRFWESNGGAGPRGTPTLANGRVYSFGATGVLNSLDASTGAVIWSRNVATDAEKKVPMWGFTSSPLVVGDLVVVAASGKLAAYDRANGKPRWFGPARPGSYSSPHLAVIDGVPQILLLTAAGATSVAPHDGSVLWDHAWPESGATIVQPALMPDGDVLMNSIASTGGLGIRRLSIAEGPGGWTVTERWTSRGLKPYFNDYVVHKGHAYGFDGNILSCIDLENGARKWKGGRYGDGQLVLLPDQDLMLVISEEGELALVKATPDQFTEVARFKAIEGKTWNHPVLVGNVLIVRNGEEMAAFRMPEWTQ